MLSPLTVTLALLALASVAEGRGGGCTPRQRQPFNQWCPPLELHENYCWYKCCLPDGTNCTFDQCTSPGGLDGVVGAGGIDTDCCANPSPCPEWTEPQTCSEGKVPIPVDPPWTEWQDMLYTCCRDGVCDMDKCTSPSDDSDFDCLASPGGERGRGWTEPQTCQEGWEVMPVPPGFFNEEMLEAHLLAQEGEGASADTSDFFRTSDSSSLAGAAFSLPLDEGNDEWWDGLSRAREILRNDDLDDEDDGDHRRRHHRGPPPPVVVGIFAGGFAAALAVVLAVCGCKRRGCSRCRSEDTAVQIRPSTPIAERAVAAPGETVVTAKLHVNDSGDRQIQEKIKKKEDKEVVVVEEGQVIRAQPSERPNVAWGLIDWSA